MKIPVRFIAFPVGAALLCSACAAPHKVPFNEADFAWAGKSGTGTLVGRAFVTLKDGSIRYAHNAMVDLVPVNAYTTETIQRYFVRGENIEDADPRQAKYRHSVLTDANGNFVFHNLPAGSYYAESAVVWHFSSTLYVSSASDPGGADVAEDVPDSSLQRVHGRASVGLGQTAHVDVTYEGTPYATS